MRPGLVAGTLNITMQCRGDGYVRVEWNEWLEGAGRVPGRLQSLDVRGSCDELIETVACSVESWILHHEGQARLALKT
jgi:hypothetical protein